MSFPAFYGVAGEMRGAHEQDFIARDSCWRCVWNFPDLELALWVRDRDGLTSCCSQPQDTGTGPSVFVWGQPLIASDTEFDLSTRIERIPIAEAPRRIACLYERYGTRAFELLEGNFCCVVANPESQDVLLVVDKFGCEDIYVRRQGQSVAFASHPELLPAPLRFDARAVAFFLAQEGFVPAPFTLFDDVETVGRAKLLRIKTNAGVMSIEGSRYWNPAGAAKDISLGACVETFHEVLNQAVESRRGKRNAILLSGGVDSALLANLLANRQPASLLALTGAVRGHGESGLEATRAAALCTELGIAHETVYVDPREESLPHEWAACVDSWTGGARITLPLFYRLAKRMSEHLGESAGAFSGQMADTLADNNYTLPSPGYTTRRVFFSPWLLRIMPFLRIVGPTKDSRAERLLTQMVKMCAGARFAEMGSSVFDGLRSQERFYAGRVFGFGEMPGCSSAAFPSLSEKGFEEIVDWYSSSFVAPIISRLAPETFYRDMMEFSMDMVMLHLDTRLVVHAFRLGGGNAELPFLDSRVVKFFASLPCTARSFYRRPKWVIEAQFGEHGYARHRAACASTSNKSDRTASFEELLLTGSLGSYFRELLSKRSIFGTVDGLMQFIDERYYELQLRAFQRNLAGVNCKFIGRVAALELWGQSCMRTVHESPTLAIA